MKHLSKIVTKIALVGLVVLGGAAMADEVAKSENSGANLNEDLNANPQSITRAGELGSFKADNKIFSGELRVSMIFKENAWRDFSAALVEFERGARSAWHTHPAGQTLIVTQGEILTGTEFGEAFIARKGDAINCPPGVKHFHGASPSKKGAHIALTARKEGKNVTWLEKLSDEEYQKFAKIAENKAKNAGKELSKNADKSASKNASKSATK